MKVSQEAGIEANFGFVPSYLELCSPKAAFFQFSKTQFKLQPMFLNFNLQPRSSEKSSLKTRSSRFLRDKRFLFEELIYNYLGNVSNC